TFAFAIAIQNLAWGLFGIFAGMAADRFGAFRVLITGALLYALGLAGMALSSTPLGFASTAGVLIGAAQAGTTYAVVYGVIGRQIDPAKRSWAMGVAAAAGSFGQFLMVPVEGFLISVVGWQQALLALAGAVLLVMPLASGLREPGFTAGHPPRREQTIGQAQRVEQGAGDQHPERAEAVGQHAGEDAEEAPRQVLDRKGEREGLAGPALRLRDRLQPEAEAVADAHGQGDDGGATDQDLAHGKAGGRLHRAIVSKHPARRSHRGVPSHESCAAV
ncbi:MAG TPA: MFS transporter, partial [Ramlibacter sp.]